MAANCTASKGCLATLITLPRRNIIKIASVIFLVLGFSTYTPNYSSQLSKLTDFLIPNPRPLDHKASFMELILDKARLSSA